MRNVDILLYFLSGLITGVIPCVIMYRTVISTIVREYNALVEEAEKLEEFISEMQLRVAENYKRIVEVDKRGSFASDDEVGFVFSFLRETVTDIYTFLTQRIERKE